jgi:hypothetical protein
METAAIIIIFSTSLLILRVLGRHYSVAEKLGEADLPAPIRLALAPDPIQPH